MKDEARERAANAVRATWGTGEANDVVKAVLDAVGYDHLVHENAVARQLVPNLDDYLEELRALAAKLGPHSACPECGMGGDVGGTEPNPIPF